NSSFVLKDRKGFRAIKDLGLGPLSREEFFMHRPRYPGNMFFGGQRISHIFASPRYASGRERPPFYPHVFRASPGQYGSEESCLDRGHFRCSSRPVAVDLFLSHTPPGVKRQQNLILSRCSPLTDELSLANGSCRSSNINFSLGLIMDDKVTHFGACGRQNVAVGKFTCFYVVDLSFAIVLVLIEHANPVTVQGTASEPTKSAENWEATPISLRKIAARIIPFLVYPLEDKAVNNRLKAELLSVTSSLQEHGPLLEASLSQHFRDFMSDLYSADVSTKGVDCGEASSRIREVLEQGKYSEQELIAKIESLEGELATGKAV
ncbi:hypothetical protein PIB30_015063, partial [Stylosanthes scabra]|nr:hypothetical protein [Stylosanthes scabra]